MGLQRCLAGKKEKHQTDFNKPCPKKVKGILVFGEEQQERIQRPKGMRLIHEGLRQSRSLAEPR